MEGKMRGPRKVRIFRDRKKSPNWYIEWRDLEGKRHCESCGPRRKAAKERANQMQTQLQAARLVGKESATPLVPTLTGIVSSGEAKQPPAMVAQIVPAQVIFRLGRKEVPVNLTIELTQELIQAVLEAISGFTST
jgi:hypothetical protein